MSKWQAGLRFDSKNKCSEIEMPLQGGGCGEEGVGVGVGVKMVVLVVYYFIHDLVVRQNDYSFWIWQFVSQNNFILIIVIVFILFGESGHFKILSIAPGLVIFKILTSNVFAWKITSIISKENMAWSIYRQLNISVCMGFSAPYIQIEFW